MYTPGEGLKGRSEIRSLALSLSLALRMRMRLGRYVHEDVYIT